MKNIFKIFLSGVFALVGLLVFAQPANDDCSGATNLGTLPTPGACISGLQNGAPVTLNSQTTVGATAPNPYTYQTACTGGGDMTTFALDTWYTFTATGTVLNVNITGFPNAQIGVYSGDCNNLLGRGCSTNGSIVVTQIFPGDVYYIQVSGNTTTATDNNFTISVDNDIDCNDCLTESNLTANPPPTNGGYAPGQVVQFCYTVTDFQEINTNWFHGVQISMGAGWTGVISNPTPAADCNVDVTAGPGDAGDGVWRWYPTGITATLGTASTADDVVWPAGFYFDNSNITGTNAGNNYGDPGNCGWTFCWDLTVSSACSNGASLSVTVNTTGDGESGSWDNIGCVDDPATVFNAIQLCCSATATNTGPYCSGSTIQLNSTGGDTYSWTGPNGFTSAAQNPTLPATAANAGVYTVTINNAGCIATASTTVVVNTTPVLTITNPTAVCSPSTINLTDAAVTSGSTGGGTLTYWTNGTATTSLSNPSAVVTTGTYYIQAANGSCTDIEPVTVTVNQTPNLVINDPASVCSGTVDITAAAVTSGSTNTGTLTYWTDLAATNSLSNPNAIGTAGTYYIQATNNGCTDIAAVTVSFASTANLVITNPAAVCSPNTVDLTAASVTAGSTGVGTLSYWTNLAATNPLSNPNAVTTSGTYYIQTVSGLCSDIEAVVVTVNASPNLIITNPAAVCQPNTVDVTAASVTSGSTGGGTLTYWTDAGATVSLSNPDVVNAGGTYYIQSTAGSCSDIEAVTVTINTTPVLTITTPVAVCSPNTIDLTDLAVTAGSTGGGTLSYWTNAGATNPLSNPNAVATSGTYYIQSANGACTDIEPVTITVNITPNLSITNPPAACTPNTVDLSASSVTAGSTGGGSLTYWTDASATIALTGENAVSASGTYYIQASSAGCTDIAPVTVTINTTPSLVITDPAAVCSPNTVDLTSAAITAGSTGGGTLTYWTNAGATTSLTTPSGVTTSGTYYIQANNSGCTDIAPVIVTINAQPQLVITDPAAVCSPLTVDITAASVTSGSTNAGSLTYWTDASATNALSSPASVSATGTYYIQAVSNGCTDIAPVVATINPLPPAPPAGTDATYCSTWEFALMAASGSGGTYTWYSDAVLTNVLETGPTLAPSNVIGTTSYYVTETLLGCEGPASVVVITVNNCEITVPTAFTPDGDGTNEYWEIVDIDLTYPNNLVMVYNRWGNLLYQSEKGNYSGKPWNGTFEGKSMPVGSYYFIIETGVEDVDPITGIVSIVLEK
jgi:gliding motility-associated-like protein